MKKADRVLLLVLAVSLFANVALTVRLQHNRVAYLSNLQEQFDARALPHAGARLDELHLLGVDGKDSDLKFDSRALPVIAYVLSPKCKWCELNRPNVDSLASQVRGKYRIIGISTTPDGLKSYQADNAIPFPLYYVDPKTTHAGFPLQVTPETLVFSSEGVFLRGWSGAYVGETKGIVSAFFGVTLPR